MAIDRWSIKKVDKLWKLTYDHGTGYFTTRAGAVRFATRMAEKVYGPRGIRS